MVHALKTLLSRYPASHRPLSAPEPLGNAGGLSGASLWRFSSGRGTLVARAWPTGGPTEGDLRRIHGWLAGAGPLDFLAAPLADRDGRTWHAIEGRLWELTPWMPGTADLRRPPPVARLRAGFAGLAAFHQGLARWRSPGPSPGLAARLAEIEALLRGGFADLDRASALPHADPTRDLARRWLAAARPIAPRLAEIARREADRSTPLQPCLRDARPDHLLFEGDRLSGLVDFGAMGVECVAADLARLLVEWVGDDRAARTEALAAYAAVRPLDESETALIAAFERTAALLVGAHWARWHLLEGRTFDDPHAARKGLARAVERVASLVTDS